MIISCIAALGKNRQLGLNNQLLWHIKSDFRHFKQTTIGHTLVMGRKTFDSIGKPLPKRETIVLSRQSLNIDGVEVFSDPQRAIDYAKEKNCSELFCAGGGEVYRQFLPLSNKLYLSYVDYDGEADVFFPEVDLSQWKLEREEVFPATESELAWTLRVLTRL